MTEKLYYQDSHRKEFEARVVSCEWNEKKEWYEVILDRTVFFPEGGGQYADPGVIDGIPVEDVKEREGEVVHMMKTPLTPGQTVHGEIDYKTRFSRMQQHSGEHIVSGLVHRYFGYDNVGFHLGNEVVTLDFNGTFEPGQLRRIETEANEAVAANLEIRVDYPTREELAALEYRSKKELAGQVRIVTVPGYDVCACCAPHVSRTGEIGLIKLVDAVNYKGGTRVTMVCGFRALEGYRMKEDTVREMSRLLSAKPHEVAEAVERLREEALLWKGKAIQMQTRYLEKKLEELPEGTVNYFVFEEDLDKNAARRFVDAGKERCSGVCGIFLGKEEGGYQFTLGSNSADLKQVLKELYSHFEGRGGGKGPMVQGTVQGSPEAIEDCLCKIISL